MRLNLAQALMCPSDLLLLDEPTNHLDLDAIIWLEDWLKRYPGTLLIISHDRDFLDEVVNVVVHIDERKLRRYSGNYSSFERQRAAQLVLAQGMMEKQMRQRAHLQSFIDRFKAQASKARQAQSRIRRWRGWSAARAAAEFSFEFRERAPNPLLTMDAVSAGYRNIDEDTQTVSEKIIVSGINFRCRPDSASACWASTAPASRPSSRPSPASCNRWRRHPVQQGPVHRLLRPAPGRDAAPR